MKATSMLKSPKKPKPPPLPCLPAVPSRRSGNEAIEQTREAMKLAHDPSNKDILARIRMLIAKAHTTPPERWTEVQKAVLDEWRRSASESMKRNLLGAVPNHPFDIYVDASQIGIGFIFRGQWQAWQLKEGWRTGSRGTQWAEAVAVELGLHLMIQAGYRGRLQLRSDNLSVVQAISGRLLHKSEIGETVQHIDDLCSRYNITLEVEWIARSNNPADAPSKLRTSDDSLRFPHSINIPSHLQLFVLPYKSPAMCECTICLRAQRELRNCDNLSRP